jgi:hypothetical protein
MTTAPASGPEEEFAIGSRPIRSTVGRFSSNDSLASLRPPFASLNGQLHQRQRRPDRLTTSN